jgi:hypothetical protein
MATENNDKEMMFATLVAGGFSIPDAAKAVKIHRVTGWEWSKRESVRAVILEMRRADEEALINTAGRHMAEHARQLTRRIDHMACRMNIQNEDTARDLTNRFGALSGRYEQFARIHRSDILALSILLTTAQRRRIESERWQIEQDQLRQLMSLEEREAGSGAGLVILPDNGRGMPLAEPLLAIEHGDK